MKAKLLLAILLLGWLTFGAWFVATPYLSVWGLERAVAAGDAAGISEHVDFPALRESVQANAAQRIQGVASALPNNPLAQLGASLATALTQTVVDNVVTPDMVALWLHGVRADGSSGAPGALGDFDLSMGYSAFSRFVVEAKHHGTNDPPLELIFVRNGFADWRLTSFRDPTLPAPAVQK